MSAFKQGDKVTVVSNVSASREQFADKNGEVADVFEGGYVVDFGGSKWTFKESDLKAAGYVAPAPPAPPADPTHL